MPSDIERAILGLLSGVQGYQSASARERAYEDRLADRKLRERSMGMRERSLEAQERAQRAREFAQLGGASLEDLERGRSLSAGLAPTLGPGGKRLEAGGFKIGPDIQPGEAQSIKDYERLLRGKPERQRLDPRLGNFTTRLGQFKKSIESGVPLSAADKAEMAFLQKQVGALTGTPDFSGIKEPIEETEPEGPGFIERFLSGFRGKSGSSNVKVRDPKTGKVMSLSPEDARIAISRGGVKVK